MSRRVSAKSCLPSRVPPLSQLTQLGTPMPSSQDLVVSDILSGVRTFLSQVFFHKLRNMLYFPPTLWSFLCFALKVARCNTVLLLTLPSKPSWCQMKLVSRCVHLVFTSSAPQSSFHSLCCSGCSLQPSSAQVTDAGFGCAPGVASKAADGVCCPDTSD